MKALISLIQPAFDWTWKNSLQVALLVGLVVLVQTVLARWLTPRLRYALSLLILLRLLLPAVPPSPLSLENLFKPAARLEAYSLAPERGHLSEASLPEASLPDAPISSMVAEPAPVTPTATLPVATPFVSAPPSRLPAVSAAEVLGLGWACGLLALVSLAGWRYAQWCRLIRQGRRLSDTRLLALLDDAREAMGVRRPVTLVAMARLGSPAVFGFRRVRLLLPETMLDQLTDQDLRLLFLHEMAHVRRHDMLLNVLLMAVQFVHWFNPLLWLGLHRLRADRELVCDAMVMQRTRPEERSGYGLLLLKLLTDFPAEQRIIPTAVPVVSSQRELKRRIVLIKHHRSASRGVYLATVMAAVALACLTFTGSSQQPPVGPESAPLSAPAGQDPCVTVRYAPDHNQAFWITNNTDKTLSIILSMIEIKVGSAWKAFSEPTEPGPRLLYFSHTADNSRRGLLTPREVGYGNLLTQSISLPENGIWRAQFTVQEALTAQESIEAAAKHPTPSAAAGGTYYGHPHVIYSEEFRPYNGSASAILVSSSLFAGLGGEPGPFRPASNNEIKGLFDLATLHPQRTRFLAELTITEPPHTKEQIADALKFQNKLMEERDRVFRKQATEIQTVRSNTIVEQASGRRVFHVQEWYSGNKYRLDQTEEATINAAFLKAFPEGYRNTYVNIRDPQFSPYESFSVNHQLRDAQLTKDPKMHYAPYRLWQCLGMSERVRVPLVMALVDKQSMKPVAPGVERNESLLKLDSWKMESIHNGSDPNWHLEAFDEQLGGTPVTCFKLRGRCFDVWSPPLEISTIRTSGLPQIEVSYWIAQKPGRNVCLQAVLTNITQHTAFFSKLDEVDEHGYPRIWETKALENNSLTKGLRVVFERIDDSPQFSDEEVFSPAFPANYIVSDVTSGQAVILRNPQPTGQYVPREMPAPAPRLKGKPMPDLGAVGLGGDATPVGKPILLCLLDVEERLSRRLVKQLAEQHDALRQKGITVVGLQAAVTSAESFQDWKGANPLPFPLGRVAEKTDKTKWASGVESLPWLILTDKAHRVTAEAFSLEELDAKLRDAQDRTDEAIREYQKTLAASRPLQEARQSNPGTNRAKPVHTLLLTADQVGALAQELANEKAQALYDFQPFTNGPPAELAAEGHWVWHELRGHGSLDVEATVRFGEDGTIPQVSVLLLDNRPMTPRSSPRPYY